MTPFPAGSWRRRRRRRRSGAGGGRRWGGRRGLVGPFWVLLGLFESFWGRSGAVGPARSARAPEGGSVPGAVPAGLALPPLPPSARCVPAGVGVGPQRCRSCSSGSTTASAACCSSWVSPRAPGQAWGGAGCEGLSRGVYEQKCEISMFLGKISVFKDPLWAKTALCPSHGTLPCFKNNCLRTELTEFLQNNS